MAHIAILMCTRNGESHIQTQLDSIFEQNHKDWSLHISDDGSTDRTQDVILDFAKNHPQNEIKIYEGPQRGFSANFQSLMLRSQIVADFYALSDQDDVWHPDKLSAGLEAVNTTQPALYGSRTTIINNHLKVTGMSPLFKQPSGFRNALVQSIMGGNTMILNAPAIELVRKAGEVEVVSHDWWLYLLISGAGGKVVYDHHPQIFYRQHSTNVFGSNNGLFAKCSRLKRLMKNEFSGWNANNIAALQKSRDLLTEASKRQLDEFSLLRSEYGLKAALHLKRLELYRQTRSGQCALYLAALLKKL